MSSSLTIIRTLFQLVIIALATVVIIKQNKYKKRKLLFLAVAFLVITSLGNTNNETTENVMNNTYDIKKIDEITKDIGMSKVNIKRNNSLDNTHFDGEKGYKIVFSGQEHSDGEAIMYVNKDKTTRSILWNDHVLYKENDGVLAKISDYELTNKEIIALMHKSREGVKVTLVSPSSAKFNDDPSEWYFEKNKEKDEIIVQSYVDSQNAFGAKIRNNFQMKYNFSLTDVKSAVVGGVEYIK